MSELIELSAAEAAAKFARGRSMPRELFEAYRDASGRRRAERVHLGRRRAARAACRATRRWAASRSPSRTCSAPRASPARPARGSSRATGRRTPRPWSSNLHAGGRAAAGQDQPGRVRDGVVERELRLRPGAQPVGPRPRAGRLVGRQRRRGRRRAGAVGDRHRHRRLDPPARGAVRDRRDQAHLRRLLALRDDRVRLLAGSGRPARPATSPTRRCCSRRWSATTRATRPRSRFPGRSSSRAPRT